MSVWLALALWCLLFAAISAAGTWMARRYALRRQLIDLPDAERRSHSVPTPRGGGIGIVLALAIAIVATILRQPLQIVLLTAAGLGLMLIAVIGWIDDHRPLSPWLRLAVHVVAALLLAAGVLLSGGGYALALAAFALCVVLVNVWNFMDGIDAIATSQAALAAAAFTAIAGGPLAMTLGLALIAACLGFLPFNWPRARIFLGDVGSGALGFAVAVLAVLALDSLESWQWPLVLLPLSAFLIDAGLTLATRILRRERWWTPHVTHAYQCWARRIGRHGPVAAGYAVWTAAAGIVAWRLRMDITSEVAMVVGSCLLAGACVWLGLRGLAAPGSTPDRGRA